MNTATVKNKRTTSEWALSTIAQMAYFTYINAEYCKMVTRFLPAGNLKDVVIHYRNNEETWNNRLMKSLKSMSIASGVDIHAGMKKDLNDDAIFAFFDIISDLKKGLDMEGIADVVKELVEVEDLQPILVNLKAIIRNEKQKQCRLVPQEQ